MFTSDENKENIPPTDFNISPIKSRNKVTSMYLKQLSDLNKKNIMDDENNSNEKYFQEIAEYDFDSLDEFTENKHTL